jgi:hypothetical protein
VLDDEDPEVDVPVVRPAPPAVIDDDTPFEDGLGVPSFLR